MEFFAHNGFYEAERKIGNRYSVHIRIETDFSDAGVEDDLDKTINYEGVYKIAEREIHKQSRLLEHIVHNINQSILNDYPSAKLAETTVCKQNPPFGGLCEEVCVSDILEN